MGLEELLRRTTPAVLGRGEGHAEQITELCRTGLVTRTQSEARPYLALRRAWGEYRRLREERARLKVLVSHQLFGLFPEFLRVWADLLQPGPWPCYAPA